MNGQVDAENAQKVWREHCRSAVRKFVMNAVVIDNEPVLSTRQDETADTVPKVARKVDDGMAASDTAQATKEKHSQANDPEPESTEKDDSKNQELNILELSDSFADQEIACAFVFPKEADEIVDKYDRIIAAALPADIVIIDWYLEDKDPGLTQKVLRGIAEKDKFEHGRMRLICIYTGQPGTDQVTRDAVQVLEEGGLKIKSDPENGSAQGKHFSLLVLNKRDVDCVKLPGRILDAFTELADGILPSFALAAVAAVRKNMHHIISRFSQDLDGAYVANRLITDPPGDVAELIRELFVSECDTALGLEKVADNYLEAEQIEKWLDFQKQPKDDACKLKKQCIDREFIDALHENGIQNSQVTVTEEKIVKFSEEKRKLISRALHGSEESSKNGEQKLARFVALKRESYGNTKINSKEKWVPSLTLGSLLQQDDEGDSKFYYCLTPACDTLRLQREVRTFLFLELFEEKQRGENNLIIVKIGDENKKLFIASRPTNIRTFEFKGSNETGRVMASPPRKGGNSLFTFKTDDNDPIELTWVGEVRKHRANRDMADLNRMWLRFGINDSEYLRLAGRGKAAM